MKRLGTTALAAVMLAGLAVSISPAAAQSDLPRVSLGSDRVAPGDVIQVRGDRWPVGGVVTIELCGNDALDITADCDVRNSIEVGVRTSTEFVGLLEIDIPPKPCPCVVRVSSPAIPIAITTPIDFPSAGFSSAEQRVPDADISRIIAITEIDVREKDEWKTWFGLPPKRTVELEVSNTGNVKVEAASLVVTTGRGSDPINIVGSRDLAILQPGESIDLVIPFELDALSIGRYTTRASIDGLGSEVVARAQTSSYPWVLIAVALVLIQLVLLKVRNRIRARIEDEMVDEGPTEALPEPPDDAGSGDQPEEPGGFAPVEIDLTEPEDDEGADEDDLEIIISQELDSVFNEDFQTCTAQHSQDEQRAIVVELAHATSARVAARSGLDESETDALDNEITEAVLASFGLSSGEQAEPPLS